MSLIEKTFIYIVKVASRVNNRLKGGNQNFLQLPLFCLCFREADDENLGCHPLFEIKQSGITTIEFPHGVD